jgi:cytochrome b subunit of formate dehydrogenase
MSKNNNRAKINYAVDLVIGLSFVLAAVSGLVLMFAGGGGGYQGGRNPRFAGEVLSLSRWVWRDLHDWSGIAMLGGVLLHLVLHWKWLVCMTRNLFRRTTRRATQASCPVEG